MAMFSSRADLEREKKVSIVGKAISAATASTTVEISTSISDSPRFPEPERGRVAYVVSPFRLVGLLDAGLEGLRPPLEAAEDLVLTHHARNAAKELVNLRLGEDRMAGHVTEVDAMMARVGRSPPGHQLLEPGRLVGLDELGQEQLRRLIRDDRCVEAEPGLNPDYPTPARLAFPALSSRLQPEP